MTTPDRDGDNARLDDDLDRLLAETDAALLKAITSALDIDAGCKAILEQPRRWERSSRPVDVAAVDLGEHTVAARLEADDPTTPLGEAITQPVRQPSLLPATYRPLVEQASGMLPLAAGAESAPPRSRERPAPAAPEPVVELVRRAAKGDEQAWAELVGRYSGLLWSVARSFGLPPQQAGDIVQTVWLRLVEHIGILHDPNRLGAWLATTARHEAIRALVARRREEPQDNASILEQAGLAQESPDAEILRREQHHRLEVALAALPPRQQQLLRLLSADPPPSYQKVAAVTGLPVGSIGPIRDRAIRRLRSLLADQPRLSMAPRHGNRPASLVELKRE
jgi:RNA polymerase sigma factor (sigma-70 family)